MAVILDGKKLSEKILEELKQKIAKGDKKPTLCVIQVGDDYASTIYVNRKGKIANEIGINSRIVRLDADTSEEKLLSTIQEMNKNPEITGILVQLPLPKGINTSKIIDAIDYKKDVDGFSVYNTGALAQGREPLSYPCTPKGVLELLKEYNISVEGKHAVVLGRSNIVGRPLALMLLNQNATVTICHSRTKNLKEITKTADILISAVGKPKFVTKDMVKEGACVIDVGINRLSSGKLAGDVDFEEVAPVCEYITPVPGGVGAMTIAMLMQNTVELFSKK